MITQARCEEAQRRAAAMLAAAAIAVGGEEIERMEIADFGLGDLDHYGLQIVTILDLPTASVRLLILTPYQICPEHRHPPLGDYPGKEETIRCAWGELLLVTPGNPPSSPRAVVPAQRGQYLTARGETVLLPGEQSTLPPGTVHWFQAGPDGAIAWTFATRTTDKADVFTDPDVRRHPVIANRD